MFHQLHHCDKPKQRMIDPLKRVMEWKSKVMCIRELQPGEFISYGTSYLTTRRERIAVVPIGYYYGFPRTLSNLGHVLIRGHRAPVVGPVNMNMVMVNVTEIPQVQNGDEVVIIGRQKKHQITLASFSDLTQILNYEVLMRLPADIPRIVVA